MTLSGSALDIRLSDLIIAAAASPRNSRHPEIHSLSNGDAVDHSRCDVTIATYASPLQCCAIGYSWIRFAPGNIRRLNVSSLPRKCKNAHIFGA